MPQEETEPRTKSNNVSQIIYLRRKTRWSLRYSHQRVTDSETISCFKRKAWVQPRRLVLFWVWYLTSVSLFAFSLDDENSKSCCSNSLLASLQLLKSTVFFFSLSFRHYIQKISRNIKLEEILCSLALKAPKDQSGFGYF